MKSSRARRLADEFAAQHMALNYDIDNPWPEDDRRHKMFNNHRHIDSHMEQMLDDLGGRPECNNLDCRRHKEECLESLTNMERIVSSYSQAYGLKHPHNYDDLWKAREFINSSKRNSEVILDD